MICDINIGEHKQTTAMRFKDIEHYEAYIISSDMDYVAEDTIFTGYIYKLNTPEFKKLTDLNTEKEQISNKILLKLLVKIALFLLVDIVL